MASIADNFDRANGAPGANWTADSGAFTITSNTLRQTTSGASYRKLRWVGSALDSNDYDVEINGRASTSGQGFGPFGRGAASATVTYYAYLGFGGDSFYLVEITAGSEAILDTGSACTASTTFNARLRCNGSNIRGYRNDVLDCEVTDTTLTSGAVGCTTFDLLNGTNEWIDDFAAADLAAATGWGGLLSNMRNKLVQA